MSKSSFFYKLSAMVLAITVSQALAIVAIFYFAMEPTLAEWPLIARATSPLSTLVTVLFIAVAYSYCRPLAKFLSATDPSEYSREQLRALQDRALNVPIYLAAQAAIFFLICTPLITMISLKTLGWPYGAGVYGAVGAVIASLIAAPLYIFAGTWLTLPVLDKTSDLLPASESARKAGMNASLRTKLILAVLCMVGAATGYTALVGYAQTTNLQIYIRSHNAVVPSAEQNHDLVKDTAPGMDKFIARFDNLPEKNLATSYLVVWAVACGAAMILTLLVSREIARPIKLLRESAERFRQGNYDRPVTLASNDELAELGQAMNAMMGTIAGQMKEMKRIVSVLRDGVNKVNETSTQVLAISSEQAAGATEQASSVQESSTIAEEMVATNRHITERAESVEREAASTLQACMDGEGRIEEAMVGFNEISMQVDSIAESLQELEARFKQTYKIAELVEEISEQTELLALNASLEAAGAGEYGQRFAVVAEATRALALQSANAANEIKRLVNKIHEATVESAGAARTGTEKVATGGKAIEQVARALATISGFADSTSSSIRDITVSTKQQTTATEQLAKSIEEVKDVAVSVMQGAKQTEASLAELKSFVGALEDAVREDMEGDSSSEG